MYDGPRFQRERPRSPKLDTADKAVIGLGCFALVAHLVFWSVVLYVIAHFVLKFW